MNQIELEGIIKEKFLELRSALDNAEAEALKLLEKNVKAAAGKSRKSLELIKKGSFELKKLVQEFKVILSGDSKTEE